MLRFTPNIKKKFKKIEEVKKETREKAGEKDKKDFRLLQKMLESQKISNDRLAMEEKKQREIELGKRSKFTSKKNSEKILK